MPALLRYGFKNGDTDKQAIVSNGVWDAQTQEETDGLNNLMLLMEDELPSFVANPHPDLALAEMMALEFGGEAVDLGAPLPAPLGPNGEQPIH